MSALPFLVRLGLTVAALVLCLLPDVASAATPVALYKSFAGNVNFTGTEQTWRSSGSNVCSVYSSTTTRTKTLSGIPAGATVQAAYLYWAGSGSSADYTVSFEGSSITAQRKYSGYYVNGSVTQYYFAGAADVSKFVKAKGNGTYSFSGLTVDSSSTYCNVEGVLGGFALLVVYSDPAQPFRVLNIYEGFQYTRNSAIQLTVSNFQTPSSIPANAGRIGHITWEGDQSLYQSGENLTFNGTTLSDTINPIGNQFNSKSSIDGDLASYGIDFDAYSIGDPIIKPGQTSAVTNYSSGQDLVWLNVEIVAVPNVPTADLAVSILRAGDPYPGATVYYTLSVANNGPDTEPGPVRVKSQVTSGRTSAIAAAGTDWTCSVSAQTVTCDYNGPVAKGGVLPPITVTTTMSSSNTGDVTTTASVSGTRFDNVTGNNTASDTWVDATATNPYAFTVGRCLAFIPFGGNGQTCTRYFGPFVAGASQDLYITALTNGVPDDVSKNTGMTFYFALSCINPSAAAGVSATIKSSSASKAVTLPLCASGSGLPSASSGAWSVGVPLTFPKGYASSNETVTFAYADVGQLQLSMSESTTGSAAWTTFVSRPDKVTFSSITNKDGGINPQGAAGKYFARAGEQFSVAVKVAMVNDKVPPNFGKETGPYGPVGVTLGQPAGSGPVAASIGRDAATGLFTGSATYDDLGAVNLTATIAGQGGQLPGTYFGAPVTTSTVKVGNFYPGYFKTQAETDMPCMPRMNCPAGNAPAGENLTVAGAVYSSQPFSVGISAFSLLGTEITDRLPSLPAAAQITLSPYSQPGAPGVAVPATVTGNTITTDSSVLKATPAIALPVQYNNTAPRASWIAPTSAYMRADAKFNRVTGTAPTGTFDTVSSNRGTSAVSEEDGVQVVNGRLMVANASGSELIRLPLHLSAQYWTGSAWENNVNDSTSNVLLATSPGTFTACKRNLLDPATATCKTVLSFAGSSATLSNGAATAWLGAPGPGNNGGVRIRMTGAPSWLPSTFGQVVFGIYKSPLIYIREVY